MARSLEAVAFRNGQEDRLLCACHGLGPLSDDAADNSAPHQQVGILSVHYDVMRRDEARASHVKDEQVGCSIWTSQAHTVPERTHSERRT